jgi:hypothetical protein
MIFPHPRLEGHQCELGWSRNHKLPSIQQTAKPAQPAKKGKGKKSDFFFIDIRNSNIYKNRVHRPQMNDRSYELQQIAEIEKWMNRKPDAISQCADGVLSPFTAVILGAKAIAKQLGVNLSKRKMAQTIPVIGAGIGACVNGWYLSDVCWAARRTFQEKWLFANRLIDRPIYRFEEPKEALEAEIIQN